MTEQWAVVIDELESSPRAIFGPFDEQKTAETFAVYLTKEVDPAIAIQLRSPLDEVLGYWRKFHHAGSDDRPLMWPPVPGSIWQDRNGDRWACCRVPHSPKASYLICLAQQADDSAEEIWRLFGPMSHVQHVAPTLNEEAPF